jgi:hypothetical protein
MEEGSQEGKSPSYQTTKLTMKTFVSGGQLGEVEKSRPIADLFPVRHAKANVTFIVFITHVLLTKTCVISRYTTFSGLYCLLCRYF